MNPLRSLIRLQQNPNEVFAPPGVKHLRNMQLETGQEPENERLCEIFAFYFNRVEHMTQSNYPTLYSN